MHKAHRESWPARLAEWFGVLGQIEETVSLTNVDNLTYVGDLTMGSASEAVSVVFDTGSLGLAVQGSSCTSNCAADTYDETGSSDYSATATGWSRTYRTSQAENYWIEASGVEAEDSITLDSTSISPLKMYMISAMSQASGESFTPDNAGWLGLTYNMESGASNDFDFIEQIIASG